MGSDAPATTTSAECSRLIVLRVLRNGRNGSHEEGEMVVMTGHGCLRGALRSSWAGRKAGPIWCGRENGNEVTGMVERMGSPWLG